MKKSILIGLILSASSAHGSLLDSTSILQKGNHSFEVQCKNGDTETVGPLDIVRQNICPSRAHNFTLSKIIQGARYYQGPERNQDAYLLIEKDEERGGFYVTPGKNYRNWGVTYFVNCPFSTAECEAQNPDSEMDAITYKILATGTLMTTASMKSKQKFITLWQE